MAKKEWVKKDFFAKFKEDVGNKQPRAEGSENRGPSNKWANPTPGNEYKVRFLPDSTGKSFYKQFFYHMYDVDGSWKFSLCPKTFNMEAYCPCCAVTAKLYKSGTASDKNEAGRFKRKEKYVANIFVVNDPRDQDKDDDQKVTGTVKLFEFATKLESNISVGAFDKDDGVGPAGFDPSEEGINFVIRVTETKPQADGKKWPDYSTSSFARNASAIVDSDEEIEDIMSKVIDLTEYLKKQLKDEADIVEDLKSEEVYDLIAEEHGKILARRESKKEVLNETSKPAKKATVVEEEEEPQEEEKQEAKKTPPKKNTEADSLDDELLEELSKM